MEPFLVRYRNLLVLLVLLAVQIVGLAVQVRHTNSGRNTLDSGDTGSVRLIRLWAYALVSPPESLSSTPSSALSASGKTTSICATSAAKTRS